MGETIMRPFALALTVAFIAAAPVTARSGYDKTSWGMTVAQVKKLYPGGFEVKLQTGEREYRVVRPVGAGMTALTVFNFGADTGGLQVVLLMFPDGTGKVDLVNGLFTPMTKVEAEKRLRLVHDALALKYGAPALSDDAKTTWYTASGEYIILSLDPDSKCTTCTPVVQYFNAQKNEKRSTEGL